MIKYFSINERKYLYDALYGVLSDVTGIDSEDLDSTLTKRMQLLNVEDIIPKDSDIEEYVEFKISNYLPRKFAIEITEDCTLRCNYCFFSSENANRPHSKYSISKLDAHKAIDFYYDLYTKAFSQIHPTNREFILEVAPPNLTWWGGEPFLAFDIIKDTLNYFKARDWEAFGIYEENLTYGMITNLTIFDSSMEKFVVENDVYTFISLDGDQVSNDKNRVFVNGKGSFQTVSDNLDRLLQNHPEYCKSRVFIQSVTADNITNDDGSNYIKDKFALYSAEQKVMACSFYPQSNSGEFLPKSSFSPRRSVEDIVASCYLELDKMSSLSEDKLKQLFAHNELINKKYKDIIDLEKSINFEYPIQDHLPTLTFSCPLGVDNFFVSARGVIFSCNKCDYQMPLGNITDGYSIDKQVSLYKNYHSKLREKCSYCWANRQCHICPAKVMYKNTFKLPSEEECDQIRYNVSIAFIHYILLNEFDNLYDCIKKITKKVDNQMTFPKSININDYKNEKN